MGRIPNYLRTATNLYKGLLTEKVVLHYLKEQGYDCEEFGHVAYFRMQNWQQIFSDLTKQYIRLRNRYSREAPPHDFEAQADGRPKTWEEHRQSELKRAEGIRHSIECHYPSEMRQEEAFERLWGQHLQQVKAYSKWLKKEGHYRPDFIAPTSIM